MSEIPLPYLLAGARIDRRPRLIKQLHRRIFTGSGTHRPIKQYVLWDCWFNLGYGSYRGLGKEHRVYYD